MTTKIICDRCGLEITADKSGHFVEGIHSVMLDFSIAKHIDLCQPCFDEYQSIVTMEREKFEIKLGQIIADWMQRVERKIH